MTTDNAQQVPAIAGVRFHEIGKLYHFACDHLENLLVGEFVIVETTRGTQLGQVMNLLDAESADDQREFKPILRKATPKDLMNQKLWKARENDALDSCREKAAQLGGLETTKFVAAQYNFDGSLLTFLFSAEDKVNTNRLRSSLQRSFKAKVELRQIGPRDVAKLLGGMGACGITRCCSTFLTDFSPISIKMAKAQGISLNPSEITGMCGRLRCCLVYEYEQYAAARKQLPKRNKRIGTPHGEGRVIDVHPLQDAVTVIVDDTRHLVEREEIIPMDEWEALQAKAAAGCSVGAEHARQQAPQHHEEEQVTNATLPEESAPLEEQDQQSEESTGKRRRRGRRGRSRRGKRNRSKHQDKDNQDQ